MSSEYGIIEAVTTLFSFKKGLDVMIVDVTADDIASAVTKDSARCAVSEAIKRQVPGAERVQTDLLTIRFSLPEKRERHIFLTPPAAQQYITDFDAGVDIVPFKFILNLEDPAWVTAPVEGPPKERKTKAKISVGGGRTKVKKKTAYVETDGEPKPHRLNVRQFGLRSLRASTTIQGKVLSPEP